MNKRQTLAQGSLSPALMSAAAIGFAQEVDWYSIDGRGGISNGGDIQLRGVVGQTDTIRMVGGGLSLSGGYLPLGPDLDSLFKDGFESTGLITFPIIWEKQNEFLSDHQFQDKTDLLLDLHDRCLSDSGGRSCIYLPG